MSSGLTAQYDILEGWGNEHCPMPPSNQFIKIIMLTETCISKIYVSGSNTLGQTGHPLSEKQFFSPQPCHFGVPILQVACGYYHTLLLLEGGWVYQAGDKQPYPYAVNAKEIINVAAGGWHSMAQQKNGDLMVWGKNDDGQLGLGHNRQVQHPELLEIAGKPFKMALGAQHSVLWNDKEILSCGKGSYGQLCHGDTASRNQFQKFQHPKTLQISCGETHTVLLDYQRKVWISGVIGKGFTLTPVEINVPTDVASICAGRKVTLIVGKDGSLFLAEDNNCQLLDIKVRKVKAKSDTFLAQDLEGRVYSWGKNNYGELALGDIEDRENPTLINGLDDIVDFDLGETHAIFLSEEQLSSRTESSVQVAANDEEYHGSQESSITISTNSPQFRQSDAQIFKGCYFNRQRTQQTPLRQVTRESTEAPAVGKENQLPHQDSLVQLETSMRRNNKVESVSSLQKIENSQYRQSIQCILKDKKIADLQLQLSQKDEIINQLQTKVLQLEQQNVQQLATMQHLRRGQH